jgi:MOSC domain-containing protein YiiM
MEGNIIAVCTSKKKGTRKTRIAQGDLDVNCGLRGDAHADCTTHRQVSLLSTSSIEKMRKLGLDVGPGDFAENLTIDGMDVVRLPVGSKVSAGQAVLEITQIGKECHTGCEISKIVGKCIMPTEGIFAKVVVGGEIKAGDEIEVC